MLRPVKGLDDLWIPLVDEPIGEVVQQIEDNDREVARLVRSPRRLLAFRTFAYIRVGLLLGQLLIEHDLEPYDGSQTWVDALLRDPAHHARVVAEIRAVAEEVGADAKYADESPLGPDPAARDRFRAFARSRLGAD